MITELHEAALKDRIKEKEALRLLMYDDSQGIKTIGYGHNLETKPISRRAAEIIFQDDLEEAMNDAQKIPEYHLLCSARRAVLVEMVFNIGLHGVMQFGKMRAAIVASNFEAAASEMIDSKWAIQVGRRAHELAEIMESGIYFPGNR